MDINQSFIISRNHEKIAVYDWVYLRKQAPRGAVLIVPTQSDYGLRYKQLAQRLNHWGFMVRSFDFYGHNASGGVKGTILNPKHFAQDFADVCADWKTCLPAGVPLIIWGYGAGATVAAQAQLQHMMDAEAYCLISPMLRLQLTLGQKIVLGIFQYLLPRRVGPSYFTPAMHTQDPDSVLLMQHDPLWVRVMSAGLGQSLFAMSKEVLSQAEEWKKPTLILYNGTRPKESAVLINGTEEFFLRSPAAIESKKYEAMYPDLFNESDKQAVYTRLQQWLDRHFPAV